MTCIYRFIFFKFYDFYFYIFFRHCLPPNFVFKKKSDKREEAEEDDKETLE